MSKAKITPLMRQYNQVKEQHPDKIVLFRMGDFYETFFEDAKTASKVLGITLTKRGNGAASEAPLAGFPHHALNNYMHKLLKAGYRVAICEQLEDPKQAVGIVKRGVTEVVTPGTAVQDQFLESSENNYLASVIFHQHRATAALIDISTGEFFVFSGSHRQIIEHIQTFSVSEILLPEDNSAEYKKKLGHVSALFTPLPQWIYDPVYAQDVFTAHFNTANLKGFGLDDDEDMLLSAGVILHYVRENFQKQLTHIRSLRKMSLSEYVGLDRFTVRNLELFQRLSGETGEGTFFWSINNTVTGMGTRLLKQWILQPLLNIGKINRRLDYVTYFTGSERICLDLREKLKSIADLERLSAKISSEKINPKELNTLKESLSGLIELENLLQGSEPEFKLHQALEIKEIIGMIHDAITDDPPVLLSQGGTFKESYHAQIAELREITGGGKQFLIRLQKAEKERLHIPTLKIGYNRVFGYYIDITKIHSDKVPETYIRKQTLANSERYITAELKEYEEKILNAEDKLNDLENTLYHQLIQSLALHIPCIQNNARKVAEIDIFSSLADLAGRNNWVRPSLNRSHSLEIQEGRHPVVEALLPPHESYVPNNHFTDAEKEQILLITGPNMSGKSTYLRQLALIVLMAQMGSFVPAKKAAIGLVDKIFTRVGASDNLAFGESTFLTEMIETANILNSATPASLILLDEIGRGTSTYDGLSIAWAVVEYLHNKEDVAARTLFATHYHELTDLERILPRVKNYNVMVKEYKDKVLFLRKIIPGAADKSYGIYVAQMAGVPADVVNRANKILHNLSSADHNLPGGQQVMEPAVAVQDTVQLSIFSPQEDALRTHLSDVDVDNLTPLEALNLINEMKKKL